jgi:predicted SAM-dependent methyltransferase
MLSRRAKATYYFLAGPLMAANGWLYRLMRAPRKGPARAQLGPGQGNYLRGWINVDANTFTSKCDVWADLRNRLPMRNGTLDAVYSHHVVEHLPDLREHFRDVFRCLRSGGAYRVGGPNGDWAIRKFLEGDSNWFSDFPERRTSLGGRFDNFLLCRNEHVAILTYSYLEELMSTAGFVNIEARAPRVATGYPELFADCLLLENESAPEAPHTLIVEATKP